MATGPVEMICIGCPRGCPMVVEVAGDRCLRVRGHACQRGQTHARSEITDPRRTITTTARVRGGSLPLVPVRSLAPIPKDSVARALREVSSVTLDAPVARGQVVLVVTGIPVVTTRPVERRRSSREPGDLPS